MDDAAKPKKYASRSVPIDHAMDPQRIELEVYEPKQPSSFLQSRATAAPFTQET